MKKVTIKQDLGDFSCDLCYSLINIKDNIMKWTTPVATEMRFGFEVTMYVMNR